MNSIMQIRIRVIANQALQAYNQVNKAQMQVGQSAASAAAQSNAAARAATTAWQRLGTTIGQAANRTTTGARSIGGSLNTHITGGFNTATTATTRFRSAMSSVFSQGMASQLQWMGRQITYNFSLPIIAAGTAATKWALESEKGFVRLSKVYGDNSPVFNRLSQTELPALQQAFRQLSDYFGVAQSEVANIGADWAQAGVSGAALAKSVRLTLETMILGEMDSKRATEALISTQAQYGFSIEQLTKAMDVLNMAENQSATSMPDLLEGFERAAGSARSAGVDFNHLTAMITSLVPASGSAANAGNALKTIFSRLLSPTREAAEVMGLMGINTQSAAWQSQTATQRLEAMAVKFHSLDGAQKAVVSSVIASRWQINKFDILMEDMYKSVDNNDKTLGRYGKTLQSVGDEQANYNQRVKELTKVLESNPQKVQQVKTMIQNAMIEAVIPMIPHIINLGQGIANMIKQFNTLDPRLQGFIKWGLVAVAAFGIFARLLGAFGVLLGTLGKPLLLITMGVIRLGYAFVAASRGLVTMAAGAARAAFGIIGGVVTAAGTVVGYGIVGIGKTFMVLPRIAMVASRGVAAAWMAMQVAFWRLAAMGPFWASLWGRITAATAAGATAVARVWAAMQVAWATVTATMARVGLVMQVAYVRATAAMGTAVTAIWAGLQMAWTRIQLAMATASRNAVVLINSIWATMQAFFISLGMAIQRIWFSLQVAMAAASRTAAVFFTRIWAAVPAAMAAIWGVLGRGWAALMTAMQLLSFNSLKGIVGGFVGGFSRLGGFIAGFGKTFIKIVAGWPGRIIALIGIIFVAIKNQMSQVGQNIAGAFSGLWQGLQNIGNGIAKMWSNIVSGIVKVFNMLPQGIQNALMAVVNMVKQAAMAVYKLFSYINPFAHHSPSLVEVVTWGMDEITKQYGRLGSVGAPFRKAAADLAAFKKAGAGLAKDDIGEARTSVAKARPSAVPAFDRVNASYKSLTALGKQYEAAVQSQTARVDALKAALDRANDALDREQRALDLSKDRLDALQGQYDAAKDKIQSYASASITGMGAMSDSIFNNDLAQKKLQLRMMDYKKANPGIEDATKKFADLQGVIETLQGRMGELRGKGAGSEILGPLQKELDAARKAQNDLGKNGGVDPKWDAMQKELEKLNNEGERLNLLNQIKFDPLTRNLDKLANAQKEIPYAYAYTQIQRQQKVMKNLEPQIANAAKATRDHEKSVKDASKAVADAQARYDAENKTLQALKDQFDQITNAVNELGDAMKQMGRDAQAALDELERAKKAKADKSGGAGGAGGKLTPGGQNFADAAGSDWADPGSNFDLGREGGFGDQSKDILNIVPEMEKISKDMFKFGDMFAPIKKGWNDTWAWIKSNIGGPLKMVWEGIKKVFSSFGSLFTAIDWSAAGKALVDAWNNIWKVIEPAVLFIRDGIVKIFEYLWPALKEAFSGIVNGFVSIWNQIKGPLGELWNALGPFIESVLPALKVAFGLVVGAVILVARAIGRVLQPVLEAIGGIFSGITDVARGFIQILTGIFNIVTGVIQSIIGIFKGLFTGDWSTLMDGLKKIFVGGFKNLLKGVGAVFKGLGKIIWSAVKGVGKILWALGKDIITGLWNGIVAAGKWLWGKIVGFIKGVINWFKDLFGIHSPSTVFAEIGGNLIKGLWEGIKALGQILWDAGKWVLQKIWDGITYLATNFWGWFKNLPQTIWNLITGAASWLSKIGGKIIEWLLNAVKVGAETLWSWIKALPKAIWSLITGAASWLSKIGGKIIAWVFNAVKTGAVAFWNWIKALPKTIWNLIVGAATWLTKIGGKIISWILTAVKSAAVGFWNWIKALPRNIWNLITAAASWLTRIGGKILDWIWNAIKSAAVGFWNWFTGLPQKIWNLIVAAATWLTKIGGKIIEWIWNAIKTGATSLWTWISGIPKKIWDLIVAAATWLTKIGSKIIGWIVEAIVSGASALWTWITGLPSLIAKKFMELVEKIKDIGRNIGKWIVDGIKDSFNINWANWTPSLVGKIGGGQGGNPFLPGSATGGEVRGPGTSTSDSIPMRLSNHEFVVTADKYRRYKPIVDAIHNGTYEQKLNRFTANNRSARTVKATGSGVTAVQTASVTTLNFYGNIEFPNIKSKDDGKMLLDGLVARGRNPR